ncbi:DUF4153 domain-containing protein [Anatilimnocola sp. NA78]|uniref:DUF4153 domain-containing protein n=1 Tax=Anatilimnocola sp. NA78 TaxID=3415683 RepID=UPI003CE57F69
MSTHADAGFPLPAKPTSNYSEHESAPRQSAASSGMSLAMVRELTAVALFVAIADVTIYRGHGFAGLATLLLATPVILLLATPVILLFGSPVRQLRGSFWLIGLMLVALAARQLWLGSVLGTLVGSLLITAFVLALRGVWPTVIDSLAVGAQLLGAGAVGMASYAQIAVGFRPRVSQSQLLQVVLPAIALLVFGSVFLFANPDLVANVEARVDAFFKLLDRWMQSGLPGPAEIVFWAFAAYLVIGLLRPIIQSSLSEGGYARLWLERSYPFEATAVGPAASVESPLYRPIRNTLVAVIVLFAVYLVFEFQTLWFREFPQGFYYAGYAHQGAAWLTVALALSTLVLSVIFRGPLLRDERIGQLRSLAWVWSALNLILALSVYNRMSIYIDFNGMTRMRMIGLFGISTVLVGFVLVLWKIVHNRDFLWLINRQMWALAGAIYLFAITPVDTLVHGYNVRQILAGDSAPAVQISVHPISAEGYLMLLPLTKADDPIIRDGVRAMLAERQRLAERNIAKRADVSWTSYQMSEELLLGRLRSAQGELADWQTPKIRAEAINRFKDYAYQWY